MTRSPVPPCPNASMTRVRSAREPLPNNSMQRTAPRAAADAERWASIRQWT